MKNKNSQNEIVGVLRSSRSEFNKINYIFKNLSAKDIYQNFKLIKKFPAAKSAVVLTKQGGLADIYTKKIPDCDIKKSIAWCCALIEDNLSILCSANTMSNKLENSIFKSDGSKALQILDNIDEVCGVSIWSAVLRASVESMFFKGEDLNGVNKIFPDINSNRFLSYVIFYINGYFSDFKIFDTSKVTHKNSIDKSAYPTVRDFLKYRFFGFELNEDYSLESIINVDKNSSLIDIYNLMVSVCEHIRVCGLEAEFEEFYSFKHVVNAIKKTGFPFCNELSGHFVSEDFLNPSVMTLMDWYTEGDYDRVLEYFNDYKEEYDFALLEIAAKSYANATVELTPNYASQLVEKMSDVLLRNKNYHESLQYLACLANSFRGLPFYRQLYYFVLRESPNKSDKIKQASDIGTLIYSKYNSPKKSIVYSWPDNDLYLKSLSINYNDSSCLNLHRFKSGLILDENVKNGAKIEDVRFERYRAKRFIKEERFTDAEEILIQLHNKADGLTKIDVLVELFNLYLASKNYIGAASLVVDSTLINSNFFSIFDTVKLFDAIEEDNVELSVIDLPIAYAMHSQNIDDKYDSRLKYAFERFVVINGMRLPTESFTRFSEFTKEKVLFFLKYVCTPEVMKLYLEFESAREIEECRLEICNFLISEDSDIDYIQFEIKNINRNLIVRKAVKQVENSRIYVDTTVFKGRKSQPFRAMFDRYLEICDKNPEGSPEDPIYLRLLEALRPNKSNVTDYWKSLSLLIVQEFKLSSKNTTFHTLAKSMAHEFTFGDKGINNYLSTRIRHGVLPTAIRKSSLAEGIFQPDNANIDFQEFSRKFPNIVFQDNDFDIFIAISSSFTSDIEKVITEFNDKRLQISRLESATSDDGNDEGMFDYFISPTETFALQQELPLSPTYDDLVKVITDWLWHRTDYVLEQVKKYIKFKFSASLNSIFEKLQGEVQDSEMSKACKSTLANAISRAKGNLQSELLNITSWFEHVDSDGDGSFDFNTAIEIAKRSLNLDLTVKDTSNWKIPQKNLSYWVDVFFILFENALSKSNIEKQNLQLSVDIEEVDNLVVIKCRNKIGESKDISLLDAELEFYRKKYGNEELIRNVIQKEGGTGFFKIWKIISKDLDINHKFEVGFTSNDIFQVEIILIKN